ncbi:hypothetical protein RI129_005666 [Pyrocoelia pectoralis]|uniref:Sulfotransferase domain-containing protein n=1 Tax=Pyrocoelia pectoralis TaxID=417401 RepID=A0AAN7VF06_9COLE
MELAFNSVNDEVLSEYFTNIFRPGYIHVKGTTLPKRFLDVCNVIENFTVYDDDLWICSFPKSGTTWTQEMIWMILNDLNFIKGKRCLGERFPFLDYEFLFDYRDVHQKVKDFNPPVHFEKSIHFVENHPRPRLIKTHLPWYLLPKQIRSGEKHPKIVSIVRNPRDVCLSYFHHCKLIEGYTGDFDTFAKLFFIGNVPYAPYWTNVLSYWEKTLDSNFLLLKFEDLKSNLSTAVRRVAKFLCKQLTDEQVSQLVNHLSFVNMKNNEAVNYASVVNLHKVLNLVRDGGSFIRSGAVGGYNLQYTEELKTRFDEWVQKGDISNELGY